MTNPEIADALAACEECTVAMHDAGVDIYNRHGFAPERIFRAMIAVSPIPAALFAALPHLGAAGVAVPVGWETPEEWELETRVCQAANRADVPEDVRQTVQDLWKQYCLAARPADDEPDAALVPSPVPQEAEPPSDGMGVFKPCVIVNEAMNFTEVTFEDVAYVATPVFPGIYHWIDKHVAMDDGRLVGAAFWATTPPVPQEAAAEPVASPRPPLGKSIPNYPEYDNVGASEWRSS